MRRGRAGLPAALVCASPEGSARGCGGSCPDPAGRGGLPWPRGGTDFGKPAAGRGAGKPGASRAPRALPLKKPPDTQVAGRSSVLQLSRGSVPPLGKSLLKKYTDFYVCGNRSVLVGQAALQQGLHIPAGSSSPGWAARPLPWHPAAGGLHPRLGLQTPFAGGTKRKFSLNQITSAGHMSQLRRLFQRETSLSCEPVHLEEILYHPVRGFPC